MYFYINDLQVKFADEIKYFKYILKRFIGAMDGSISQGQFCLLPTTSPYIQWILNVISAWCMLSH